MPLQALLDRASPSDHAPLLAQMLPIELEARRKRGEKSQLGEYDESKTGDVLHVSRFLPQEVDR